MLDCDEAIRLNPENASAYAKRGFALNKLGKFQKAIDDLTRALNLNYVTADVFKTRGLALCETEKWDIAIVDFSRAIKIQPGDVSNYTARSRALHKLAQLDDEHALAMSQHSRLAKP